MNIARSISLIFVSRMLTVVLGLLSLTVFARIIPSGQLGAFFLFQSLLGILTVPADLGVRTAITKRLSEESDREIYYTSGLVVKAALILAVAALVYVFRAQVNRYIGQDVALLLVAAVAVQEFGLYYVSVLKGELKVGESQIWELLKTLGWTLLGGSLAYLGLITPTRALIVGLITGSAVMTAVGIVRTSMKLRPPTVRHTASILKFGSFATLESVGGMVNSRADVLILGVFVSSSKVAAYEIAWRFSTNVALLSLAIRTVLFPQASNWFANDQRERIEDVLPDFITLSLVVSVPTVVGGLLLNEQILTHVFTPEYAVASTAFAVLLINMLDNSVVYIVGGGLLHAFDRPDLSLRATAVATALNLMLNVVLIAEFGLVGAAVATTAASLVGTAINIRYVQQFIVIRIDWHRIGWIVVSSLFMGGALSLVLSTITITGIVPLLGVILLGAAIYFSLILSVSRFRIMLRNTVAELM